MKPIKPRFWLIALTTCLWLNTGQATIPLSKLSDINEQGVPSLAPMLNQVTPAVVNISTRGRLRNRADNPLLSDPFFRRFFSLPAQPRSRETQSLGSGVVVDARRGYIVTNNHVIAKAEEITVTLRDRRSLQAKLVGSDPETDIAVIQVDANALDQVPMADSDKLQVGDFVVAIGNPFGLGQTVTSGIVSALGRSGLGIEGYEDFIQTDASINPGNSGGALVNLSGELVGINTAILSPGGSGNVGIGFAIPINMVKEILDQLVEYGRVKRGQLGVSVQDLTEDLAKAFGMEQIEGAVIAQILPDSSAEKSGLKAGDVVIAVNGRSVRDAAGLRNSIGLLRAGEKVDLTVIRNGEVRQISTTVTAVEQQTLDGGRLSPWLKGAKLGIIQTDGSGIDSDRVQVLSVTRSSNAWRAGLRENDIIISANRILVSNFKQLQQALKRSRRGILLNIHRGDEALFLLIQ